MQQIVRDGYTNDYCPECHLIRTNGSIISARHYKPDKYPVWTCLYFSPQGCFNVEFGQGAGPKITQNTAIALAWDYLKKHPKVSGVHALGHGSRELNGW